LKKTFEEILKDENIIKISKKASSSFRYYLSSDEIHTCVLNAIWKASEKYDVTKGSKFTTYVYNGIIIECLTQKKFNQKNKKHQQIHKNIKAIKDPALEIDLLDEIDTKCKDKNLIYNYYIDNYTINELAKRNGVSIETIRTRIKKNVNKVKDYF